MFIGLVAAILAIEIRAAMTYDVKLKRHLSMTPRAIKRRANVAAARLAAECLDCGVCTTNMRDGDEYYMVHNAIWYRINPQETGMLCIGCLENRLGRKLVSGDFTHAPINNLGRWHSARLVDRLRTYKE